MTISNREKFKTRKKEKVYFFFRPIGWVLFLISTVFFPLVYGFAYFLNREYKYSHKVFFKKYCQELKDMLLGTWRGYTK